MLYPSAQFLVISRLEFPLAPAEERADRIVDEVEREIGVGHSVAEAVEKMQRSSSFVNTPPPRCLSAFLGRCSMERADQAHAMLR